MLFSRKNVYFPFPPIVIDDIPVPYSVKFKFLGLLIDFKVKWKVHIQHVRSKLSSVCGIIYNIRHKITIPVAKVLYFSLAYSHLTYCSSIWSSAHNSYLQMLGVTQRKILRIICKSNRRSNTSALFKQMKFLKTSDIFKLNTLLFVYKSINNLIESPIMYNNRYIEAYNLRGRPQLAIPNHLSKQSERFIHIRGAKWWNDLPENIKNCRSLCSFKFQFKKYCLDSYG